MTFPAGLPSPEPAPKGAQWDPAPVPRGLAGTRYSPPCKNSGSRSPYLVSHRKETPSGRGRFRPEPRPAPSHRACATRGCQRGRVRFRVLQMFRGWGWNEVALQQLNLLSAGLRLSAKPACRLQPPPRLCVYHWSLRYGIGAGASHIKAPPLLAGSGRGTDK